MDLQTWFGDQCRPWPGTNLLVTRPFGIAEALNKYLPRMSVQLEGLASMELLNLSAYHANNKRVFPPPLSTFALECAIGDMRRLAALLHFFMKGLEQWKIFSDMQTCVKAVTRC